MNAETLKELLAKATPAPWIYRPDKYDDWGTVKSGQFHICQARDPRYLDDEYLNACRGEKRDPWEANARLIALSPQLAADNIALQAEVERLREALLPFAEYADECDEYRYDDFNQAPVTAGDCRQARAALNETQERNDDQ